MKLLFLSQGHKVTDHPGYHDALIKLKNEGFISDFFNLPFFGYAKEHGWDGFYNEVVRLCKEENFDIVFFQFFHSNAISDPTNYVEILKKLDKPPIIISSCGDGFSDNWMRHDYPNSFKQISRMADITFSTQMGKAADKMINWGANNIVLAPNGMCQVRFKAQNVDLSHHKFEYDIVFVGSNNGNRLFNPISKHWWGAKKRQELVKALFKKFGNRFGLFGNGWNYPCSKGPIPFDQQQNVFRKGRIIVGGNPYSLSDYYSSNRLFFEIASGIPTVELYVPRLDKIFRNNDHCYFVNDIDEVVERCEQLLKEDKEELYIKAAIAAKYVEEKHTDYHRMKFMLDTVKRYIKNNKKLDVDFPFFLPEVDLNEEQKYAKRIRID
ncbi:MAG: glycosyltransferase [Melioribacteraceae bacterium]